MNEILKGRRL